MLDLLLYWRSDSRSVIFLTSTNSQLTDTSQGRLKEAGLPIEGRARIPGLHVIIFIPNLLQQLATRTTRLQAELVSRAGVSSTLQLSKTVRKCKFFNIIKSLHLMSHIIYFCQCWMCLCDQFLRPPTRVVLKVLLQPK